jgi:hypothetical protein
MPPDYLKRSMAGNPRYLIEGEAERYGGRLEQLDAPVEILDASGSCSRPEKTAIAEFSSGAPSSML